MFSRLQVWRVLVCIFLFSLLSGVHAGSFKVNPLGLEFKPQTKTTVLKLTNTDESDVTVQLEAKKWLQDSAGGDYYEESGDIVFFPRIVTLKPGEERVVRVGFKGKHDSRSELSYRLFVQELPNRSGKAGTLQFALRFSVPIFVQPAQKTGTVALDDIRAGNGVVSVSVQNSGNTHAKLQSITVRGLDTSNKEVFSLEQDGWYLLKDAGRRYKLALPMESCRKASILQIKAQLSERGIESNYRLREPACN